MKKYLIVIFLFPSILLHSQNVDIHLLRNINLNRNRGLDHTFIGITNSATPVAFGLPVLLYGVSLIKNDSTTRQKAIHIGASVVCASGVAIVLKYMVNRPRPSKTYPDIQDLAGEGSPSFPSGHTSVAFALATSVSMDYPRWYIIIPSYAWAGAVGWSRMDLGVHYPSDVLAGAIIGAGSAYLCHKGQQWLSHKQRQLRHDRIPE